MGKRLPLPTSTVTRVAPHWHPTRTPVPGTRPTATIDGEGPPGLAGLAGLASLASGRAPHHTHGRRGRMHPDLLVWDAGVLPPPSVGRAVVPSPCLSARVLDTLLRAACRRSAREQKNCRRGANPARPSQNNP